RRPMATASRSRAPAGAKSRPRAPLAAMPAADAARSWGVPALALAVITFLAALSAAGTVGSAAALAGTVAAALVLLLYISERPLLIGAHPPRARLLGAGRGLVWFAACYLPCHLRLFPGAPLIDAAHVTPAGSGLPVRIPAAGRAAVHRALEARLGARDRWRAHRLHCRRARHGPHLLDEQRRPPRLLGPDRLDDLRRAARLHRRSRRVVDGEAPHCRPSVLTAR